MQSKIEVINLKPDTAAGDSVVQLSGNTSSYSPRLTNTRG